MAMGGTGGGLCRGSRVPRNLPHHLLSPSNGSSWRKPSQIPRVANIQVSDANGVLHEHPVQKERKEPIPVLFPPASSAASSSARGPPLLQPPQPLHTQVLHLQALKTDLSRCSTLSEKVRFVRVRACKLAELCGPGSLYSMAQSFWR